MSTNRGAEPVLTEVKVWMARRRKRLAGKVALTVADLTAVAEALDVPAAEFFRPVVLDKRPTRDTVQYRYPVSRMGTPVPPLVKVAS